MRISNKMRRAMEEDGYITAAQAAQMLGYGRQKMKQTLESGRIPAFILENMSCQWVRILDVESLRQVRVRSSSLAWQEPNNVD